MAEEQHNPALTSGDIEPRESFTGVRCAVCADPKSRVQAFCQSCTLALPIWVRNSLALGPDSQHFDSTYRSALQHLQLWRDRIKRVSPVRGGWSFRSLNELEDAGYKLLNSSRCRATGCNEPIGWVEDQCGNKIPVNLSDFQKHRVTCKNPEAFSATKSVRTSAQRRRRPRR